MPYGNIVRIEPARGFGFIRDDGGMDWFFVTAGLRNGSFESIWLDQRVGFTPEWTPQGPRATDIHHEQLD